MKGTNYSFGTRYYPGNTATESVYCRNHGKIIKGGFKYKLFSKMKLHPGDIVFKSNSSKNPYGTTYHVEMFTGYICAGFNENGKPIILDDWGARQPGYASGIKKGSLLARPLSN